MDQKQERDVMQVARHYLEHEKNTVFRDEVACLLEEGNQSELLERFSLDLTFGTGGIRGVMGGGSFRMNPYLIRRVTQGIASYLLSAISPSSGERSVAISYDSRRHSALFAKEVALTFAANGIRAHLFPVLHPTPQLAFAVRHLQAAAGIMITASHNPPEYNGYKVYWSDGAQVTPPHDKGLMSAIERVCDPIPTLPEEQARKEGLLVDVSPQVDEAYFKAIRKQVVNPSVFSQEGTPFRVVYTPLHGTGGAPMERLFHEWGVDARIVESQKEPDGRFPTVDSPNPEEEDAMSMALSCAHNNGADLVLATDPDADRLGVAVRCGDDYQLITGNQLGSLMADYIFSTLVKQGRLPPHPAFVHTIVTTEMQRLIAADHGVTVFEVLTGFKYIGEKIGQFETKGDYTYLFGCEESCGYLIGTSVRDKDAISAALLTIEMALWHRLKGKSLLDQLSALYCRHGYFQEALVSETFEGTKGNALRHRFMTMMREKGPKKLGGMEVIGKRDYLEGGEGGLPPSDVLQYSLTGGTRVTVRPSGTEPKIKLYFSVREEKTLPLKEAQQRAGATIETLQREMKSLVEDIVSSKVSLS